MSPHTAAYPISRPERSVDPLRLQQPLLALTYRQEGR
jgi:hypothetical protein